MSESVPNYVTCHCQHCDKGIEFDANGLTHENNIVTCPHCRRETVLSVPNNRLPVQTQAQPQNTGLNPDLWRDLPNSDEDELTHHELRGTATPKQVAYLTYMGVKNAESLTKQQAYDLIESNRFFNEPQSMAELERQRSHQASWDKKRLMLYPDIYASELKEYLHDKLPNELHAFVRGQVIGASERLTKPKIREVVKFLTDEDANWWHRDDHQTVFFDRLQVIYPSCCDGRTPDKQTKPQVYSSIQISTPAKKKSGCLVVLSLVFLFIILCAILTL